MIHVKPEEEEEIVMRSKRLESPGPRGPASASAGRWPVGVALLVLTLLGAGAVLGQGTGASIRGVVSDVNGPIPIAVVVAVDTASGFRYSAKAGPDGSYVLAGLRPATYVVTASSEAYKDEKSTIQVLIGQEAVVNFKLSPSETVAEGVTVVAGTSAEPIDVRSNEIATNITPTQMQSLPQNNRNFLAFAALAPGVSFTVDQDAQGQTFRSGASNPKQVNVFIDGLSYKNDIIQGGAFMQDSSKGNPFPQAAVQEYKVLTMNYKAEYEKAAAAVITAVTKSGGNEFHGEAFGLDQTKGMVAQDPISEARGDKKPDYKREQYGFSLGGPIQRDKVNFFITAERNKQNRATSVFRGSAYDLAPANVRSLLDPYKTGTVTEPFDEKLYFGKLSVQPASWQTLDVSYTKRDESEIRGFGGQRVEQGAEDMVVKTDSLVARHQMVASRALNEASLAWQRQVWNPTGANTSVPHLVYEGLLDVGGKDSTQDLQQKKTSFRDDFSYMVDWHGAHSLKTGVTYAKADYDFRRLNDFNPTFSFRAQEGWQFPYSARIGAGDPKAVFGNNQYGLYLQDDWQVLSNLTINVGVRWDYETNMANNDYVTPQAIADGLRNDCTTFPYTVGGKSTWCFTDLFNVNNYISNGHNRSSYKGMYQPRVGFAWDVTSKGETVVFGGWGKYYDRVNLTEVVDEKFKQSWKTYSFCFSADGSPTPGCGGTQFQWNPNYLTRDGLLNLVNTGQVGGEVFLLPNNLRPPYTNQWSLGLRQKLGSWNGSLAYANSRGYNGVIWSWAGQPPGAAWDHRWDHIEIPGYAGIFRAFDVRRTWYDGYYLTLDKPYMPDSRWGFHLAYTYSDGYWEASGDEGAAFAFDFPENQWDKYRFPANGNEKHHLVMSGTVGLPAGFTVSSLITLGSGTPYQQPDASNGWGDGSTYGAGFVYRYNNVYPKKQTFLGLKEWAYRSVDLRVEWQAPAIGNAVHLSLIAEGFNIFNYANYTYDPWFSFLIPPPPDANSNYNKPSAAFNSRRYQVGLRVTF